MSRLGNLVIDTADILAQATTSSERWWAINRVARRIGANAINAGACQWDTKRIDWMRSSMDPRWLEEYAGAGLRAADPVLHDALSGVAMGRYRFDQVDKVFFERPKYGHLMDTMRIYDYNFMIANTWVNGGTAQCVSVAFEDDPGCLFGRGGKIAFSTISAMMTCALLPPGDELHEGWAWGTDWQKLLVKERDALAFMYRGLPEYMIAEAMKISEYEVWCLLHAASLKMRARNRVQALALAISRGEVEP